jgi:hypothetical protein
VAVGAGRCELVSKLEDLPCWVAKEPGEVTRPLRRSPKAKPAARVDNSHELPPEPYRASPASCNNSRPRFRSTRGSRNG